MKMRPNRREQVCAECDRKVAAGAGCLIKSQRLKDMDQWLVYHSQCAPELVRAQSVLDERKELTAEGILYHPYDETVIPKIRALPGAWWHQEFQHWTVSVEHQDREVLLKTARELELKVASQLLVARDFSEIKAKAQQLHLTQYETECATWQSFRRNGIVNTPDARLPTIAAIDARTPTILITSMRDAWASALSVRLELTVRMCGSKKDIWEWPQPGEVVITFFRRLPAAFEPVLIGWSDKEREIKAVNFTPLARASAAPCLLIVDGIDRLSYKTQTGQRIFGLGGQVKTKWFLGQLPKDPGKLWSVLTTMHLSRHAFGTYDTFRRCFNGRAGKRGAMEWGSPTDEALLRLRNIAFEETLLNDS